MYLCAHLCDGLYEINEMDVTSVMTRLQNTKHRQFLKAEPQTMSLRLATREYALCMDSQMKIFPQEFGTLEEIKYTSEQHDLSIGKLKQNSRGRRRKCWQNNKTNYTR